jgi:uncharacterized protein
VEKIKRIEDILILPETIGEAGIENDVSISPEVMAGVFKDQDLAVVKPFKIHYEAEREGESDTIHVVVDVRGEIEAACARCLEAVVHTMDLHLETDYLPAEPDMASDLEGERTSSEIGYYRKSIHLGEFIVSEMVLALPLRFICNEEECKGLCPGCGVNLNREECRCETPVDPRMKKLAELKDKIRRK